MIWKATILSGNEKAEEEPNATNVNKTIKASATKEEISEKSGEQDEIMYSVVDGNAAGKEKSPDSIRIFATAMATFKGAVSINDSGKVKVSSVDKP
jgi:hypothetical protein